MFPLPGLKQTRLRQLLSQERLARAAGVSEVTIIQIEKGKPARLSTIRKLADALNVDPVELLGEEQGKAAAAA